MQFILNCKKTKGYKKISVFKLIYTCRFSFIWNKMYHVKQQVLVCQSPVTVIFTSRLLQKLVICIYSKSVQISSVNFYGKWMIYYTLLQSEWFYILL